MIGESIMGKYRKHMLLILVLLPILFLNGCIKFHYNVTVNNDMTANEELIFGVSESLFAMGMMTVDEEEFIDMLKNELIDEGYIVEDYDENAIIDIKANRKSLSMEDVLVLLDDYYLTYDSHFETESGLLSRTYHVNTNADLADLTKVEQAMFAIIDSDMKFTLTTPFELIDHNADKVSEDGKTLEWIIYPDQNKNIQASFREYRLNFAFIIPIIIIVAVPFIIKGLRNKKRTIEEV